MNPSVAEAVRTPVGVGVVMRVTPYHSQCEPDAHWLYQVRVDGYLHPFKSHELRSVR